MYFNTLMMTTAVMAGAVSAANTGNNNANNGNNNANNGGNNANGGGLALLAANVQTGSQSTGLDSTAEAGQAASATYVPHNQMLETSTYKPQ